MLDKKHTEDCMDAIRKDLSALNLNLDIWAYESISARISLALVQVYQEGMRDALLQMGSYIKS